ncbi:hypothetical protein QAY89_gp52 [Xanthomonas phage Langgrundblatt1]|uniref:Uncharacterized protein n=1 Tax=Xanthomonas phage Langgrundblatt1 TaxID=2939128 RepID=A0A9E7E0V9_9CAUD|nr:hypothetical protein QAY89_gp52 [Xanthomonas phage Langgrundblatt1]URA06817.1 hypothetical protein Langgrundblatt1_BL10052 [Xanthomonas phage Langgrundblatt1]
MNSNNLMITGQTNELRMQVQDAAVNAHKWMTCLNCINWQGNKGMQPQCELFKALPPPHIIVSGCKDHEFDIPF